MASSEDASITLGDELTGQVERIIDAKQDVGDILEAAGESLESLMRTMPGEELIELLRSVRDDIVAHRFDQESIPLRELHRLAARRVHEDPAFHEHRGQFEAHLKEIFQYIGRTPEDGAPIDDVDAIQAGDKDDRTSRPGASLGSGWKMNSDSWIGSSVLVLPPEPTAAAAAAVQIDTARALARSAPVEVREEMPVVPADLLGTSRHPFGRSYRQVSEQEIDRIVALPDPVQRNLRITQAYHDLKMSMTFLVGRKNVNWCAFATWASRTTGHLIRGDHIPGLVQAYLEQVKSFHNAIHLAHRMVAKLHRNALLPHSVLAASIERAARLVSDHLAHGNLLVFAEIAPLFARMHEEFRGATTYDAHAIERFVGRLRRGHVLEGGQDLLISGFRGYYRAMFERDPKKRAELILLANDSIGYHEHSLMQADIVRSVDAPIAATIIRAAHERVQEVSRGWLTSSIHRLIDRVLTPFSNWLQRVWADVAMRWIMRMDMPDGVLDLVGGASRPEMNDIFPPELATIENPELRALLYELDFTPSSTRGSPASNCIDLTGRMNFIVDFFRTYQQDKSLLQAPFTDQQVESIRNGGIPEGAL